MSVVEQVLLHHTTLYIAYVFVPTHNTHRAGNTTLVDQVLRHCTIRYTCLYTTLFRGMSDSIHGTNDKRVAQGGIPPASELNGNPRDSVRYPHLVLLLELA